MANDSIQSAHIHGTIVAGTKLLPLSHCCMYPCPWTMWGGLPLVVSRRKQHPFTSTDVIYMYRMVPTHTHISILEMKTKKKKKRKKEKRGGGRVDQAWMYRPTAHVHVWTGRVSQFHSLIFWRGNDVPTQPSPSWPSVTIPASYQITSDDAIRPRLWWRSLYLALGPACRRLATPRTQASRLVWGWSTKILQNFSIFPIILNLWHMHEALNIDKK
jgi:hypothetical protein